MPSKFDKVCWNYDIKLQKYDVNNYDTESQY